MYRTGDLARYLPDGSIVYEGRATAQAKVNGQRVELGEIEFHVRQAIRPSTREVVVEVAKTVDGHDFICACLAPESGRAGSGARSTTADDVVAKLIMPSPTGLQDRLKDVLPIAMVPSVFLEMSHMPLTPTGKVDRRALKELAGRFRRDEILPSLAACSDAAAPLLDDQQRRMRDVWARVLKIDPARVGLQSDFFQLGGDSISAMRLVKACHEYGLSVTVADVLRHSQFVELCRRVRVANIAANGDNAPSQNHAQPEDVLLQRGCGHSP